MKLDFSEVKETKPIPEGESEVTIKSAEECRSQNGTPMLKVGFEDAEGNFSMDNICLAGAGAFKAKQFFNALGIDLDTAESMEAADLIGMSIIARFENEEYEGETRSKVKKYIA